MHEYQRSQTYYNLLCLAKYYSKPFISKRSTIRCFIERILEHVSEYLSNMYVVLWHRSTRKFEMFLTRKMHLN